MPTAAVAHGQAHFGARSDFQSRVGGGVDFEDVKRSLFLRTRLMPNKPIDIIKLDELRTTYPRATYRQLGELLAQKEGRKMPYTSAVIYKTLNAWRKFIEEDE